MPTKTRKPGCNLADVSKDPEIRDLKSAKTFKSEEET